MSVENYRFRRSLGAASLTVLGLLAAGCAGGGEDGEYKNVEKCGVVDDRLATTGSKIDAARLFFGDGNITQVPDDLYYIHTVEHGTVEIEDPKDYLNYQVGTEYCETESVWVPAVTK